MSNPSASIFHSAAPTYIDRSKLPSTTTRRRSSLSSPDTGAQHSDFQVDAGVIDFRFRHKDMSISFSDFKQVSTQMRSQQRIEASRSKIEEVIYDLLERSSGHLELIEDPEQGAVIAGLRCIKVNSAGRILETSSLKV
ncbi:hypothetical protein LXL04_007875 [Taraxacum kok-saghyz]